LSEIEGLGVVVAPSNRSQATLLLYFGGGWLDARSPTPLRFTFSIH